MSALVDRLIAELDDRLAGMSESDRARYLTVMRRFWSTRRALFAQSRGESELQMRPEDRLDAGGIARMLIALGTRLAPLEGRHAVPDDPPAALVIDLAAHLAPGRAPQARR